MDGVDGGEHRQKGKRMSLAYGAMPPEVQRSLQRRGGQGAAGGRTHLDLIKLQQKEMAEAELASQRQTAGKGGAAPGGTVGGGAADGGGVERPLGSPSTPKSRLDKFRQVAQVIRKKVSRGQSSKGSSRGGRGRFDSIDSDSDSDEEDESPEAILIEEESATYRLILNSLKATYVFACLLLRAYLLRDHSS